MSFVVNQKKKGGRKVFKAVKKPVIKKQAVRPAPIVPSVQLYHYADQYKLVDREDSDRSSNNAS